MTKDNEHLFISNEFEFSNEDKFQKNKILKLKTTDNFKIKYNKYINYEVNEKKRK